MLPKQEIVDNGIRNTDYKRIAGSESDAIGTRGRKHLDKFAKIIEDKDGKEVVLIDNIMFKGKRKINWKEVERYLKEYVGKSYVIMETSEKIYIGKEFPDEYVGSQDTARLKGALAKAKANAAQGVAQIIKIATNPTFSDNYEEKHIHNAKYGWKRYDSRFALPVYDELGNVGRYNVFTARILIRCAEDGKKYLYDILRIKKETSTPLEQ